MSSFLARLWCLIAHPHLHIYDRPVVLCRRCDFEVVR